MENRNSNNKRRKEMTEAAEMAGNGSRWQPTKEQIEILESVYSAGVKTPSAEQIQQITARLSVYGTIEGKNVFYWFQNTKARRRQKLKQDRLALLTRFYPPPPPPPPPQVYYPPIIPNVTETGFYYYHCDQGYMMEAPLMEKRRWIPCEPRNSKRNQEECKTTTLELFPLRPGGDSSGSNGSNSSDQTNDEDSACKDGERLIDFLSGNCSSATETNE